MSRFLSLTAVTMVAMGAMLAMPARSDAAFPVAVSVGVGPVVGSVSTYPIAPYAAYPVPLMVAPACPAPVIVRPPVYYRGYGCYQRPYYHGYHHGWHR